jgi:hypothetical protein
MKKSTPKPKTLGEREARIIRGAAYRLWEYLAGDLMACRVAMGETGPISRAEVLEVVIDADRLAQDLRDRYGKILPPEVLDWVCDKASYRQLVSFLKPAFPYAYYE